MSSRRFVLLDRDGTINVERQYLSHPGQLELLPGAAAGLRALQSLGLGLVVVTNQSGIARGYFDEDRADAVHRRLEEMLKEAGVSLTGIFLCPHGPDDECTCRKPRPGMARAAAREYGFELSECFVVGDKPCDIELGQAIGATTLLVRTGYGAHWATQLAGASLLRLSRVSVKPQHIVDDLREAADVIGRIIVSERAESDPDRGAA